MAHTSKSNRIVSVSLLCVGVFTLFIVGFGFLGDQNISVNTASAATSISALESLEPAAGGTHLSGHYQLFENTRALSLK